MDNNINYIAFDFVEGNNNEISPENVEVEITALDQYKIAEYTFNNALYDFFPEFNEGYTYTYEDTDVKIQAIDMKGIALEYGAISSETGMPVSTVPDQGDNTILRRTVDYIKITPDTEYEFIFEENSNNVFLNEHNKIFIAWYDSNKNFIYLEYNRIVTSPTNGEYMKLWESTGLENLLYVSTNGINRTIYSNELPTLIRFGVLWREDDNYGDEKWNNSLLEVEYINTTNIIDASNLFTRNVNMNKINNFNITNKITVLNEVFLSCESLTSLDVSNWDVSNVTNMNSLFNSCTNLESIKGLENWDVRKVYYMTNLFSQCSKLKSLNISNWHLNSEVNVTDMFTVTNALTNVIMNNSDYNSVNKVITALPTRTTDSPGTLNIEGVDDSSQVDIATAQSKFWNVVGGPEEPEPEIPVDYSIALRPISATQDSGYNNTWTNIANTYDTDTSTSGTIIVTGSSQSGFKRKYVDTIFNFDNPIPANAIINSAVLTIRAKQSATTNLNITASIGSDEVIGSTLLSSSAANYTADIANYVKGLNQLNINLTSAATSNRTFTLYDVRVDVNYTAYEMPKPTYTVTFKDWDGFVFKTEKVEEGSSATAPSNPTRDGYTFIGWDVAFDNITSDLTVTAQYEEITDPDGPEDGMNNIKLGSDTIKNMYIGDSRIIQMYLNGQPLM